MFHVLAHVRVAGNPPASLFEPKYTRWVVKFAGDATHRTLAEDVAVLGKLCPDHESLGRLSLGAFLFRDVAQATSCQTRALKDLKSSETARPDLHARLKSEAAAELLRTTALLELGAFRKLPTPQTCMAEFEQRLQSMSRIAPHLLHLTVHCAPALGVRGRAFGDGIWVGLPNEAFGPSARHAAWQAAHEATALEAREGFVAQGSLPSHDELEQVAVLTLQARAAGALLSVEHQSWLVSHSCLPELRRAALSSAAETVLDAMLSKA